MRAFLASFVATAGLLGAIGCTPTPVAPEPVVLTLHIGDQLHLDGQAVALDGLAARLSASVAATPTYIIFDVTPEAPMSAYQNAMRHVREANVAGVRAAGAVGGFQPVVLR